MSITSLTPYARQVRKTLGSWLLQPRVRLGLRVAVLLLAGWCSAAAALGNRFLPLTVGLCCAVTGWEAVLVTLGGCAGYLMLWGSPGWQAVAWLLSALAVVTVAGDRRIFRQTQLLYPAVAVLITAGWGLVFQNWLADTTPVGFYLLRLACAGGSCWVFRQVIRGRNPICEWFCWGFGGLALAQLAPLPWLGFGYILAAAACVAGTFPGAVMAGLGLDLAGITPVPMTAVVCAGYLVRFLPRCPRPVCCFAPAAAALLVMQSGCGMDFWMLPGLVAGGLLGLALPLPGRLPYRRGETGVAQVRLEMAAGVLAQTEQILLEAPPPPVDEDALVRRAAEQACAGCPCRHSCKDSARIAQLPGPVLHKSLLSPEELPVNCRRSGRFLAQLHRSQEQLRSIRADRERQKEYKAAVLQQFQFLSEFLRSLADQLPRRAEVCRPVFTPVVQVYGNRPQEENGDRCIHFYGTAGRYYVLLCDGMGTGPGAVEEARTAGSVLKQLLAAGYPASHALRSLNSLCALRERAGAVTVDLAELQLESGKVQLYKWGAPASWLIRRICVERLGIPGPPPGLSVTQYRETVEQFTLRRGELLLLLSDGIEPEQAQACCRSLGADTKGGLGELARTLLGCAAGEKQDDATAVLIRLETKP